MGNEKMVQLLSECLENENVKGILRAMLQEQSEHICSELKRCNDCNIVNKLQDDMKTTQIKEVTLNNKILEQEQIIHSQNTTLELQKQQMEEAWQNNSNYQIEVQRLKDYISEQEELMAKKNTELEQLQASYDTLMEVKLQKTSELEVFENIYGEVNKLIDRYRMTNTDTRRKLNNIFRSTEPAVFLSAGAQWQNIDGLWNFIERKVIEAYHEDIEVLKDIFAYFFKCYNSMYEAPFYELIQPATGTKFDSDYHHILGTKTDGYVTKVCLAGYVNNRTKKVVNKALITV